MTRGICTVSDETGTCERTLKGHGLCDTHYRRLRRTGSAGTAEILPKTRRDWTLSVVLERVEKNAAGCWLWTVSVASDGYGRAKRGSEAIFAHRLVYEELVGEIPEGLVLDHVCHSNDLTCPGGAECLHRRCVNPGHLEPVTHAENHRRMIRNRAAHPKPLKPINHGTAAGYELHRRRGVAACDPCRVAHAERERRNRLRRDAAQSDREAVAA